MVLPVAYANCPASRSRAGQAGSRPCDIDCAVLEISDVQMWLAVVLGWLDRQEREALAYLIEENRVLRAQLSGRRLRLTDDDRRRLGVRAFRLGRKALCHVATIVTPDTLLRWHRQLIARKWTYARTSRRRGVLAEIRRLVVRMAEDNRAAFMDILHFRARVLASPVTEGWNAPRP